MQGEEAALVVFRHRAQLRCHVRDDVGQAGGGEVGDAEEGLLGQDARTAGDVGPGDQALSAPRYQHDFEHGIRHRGICCVRGEGGCIREREGVSLNGGETRVLFGNI